MSINIIGREFIDVDALPAVASLTLAGANPQVSGTAFNEVNVTPTTVNVPLVAQPASVNLEVRVFAETGARSLTGFNPVVEGSVEPVDTNVTVSQANLSLSPATAVIVSPSDRNDNAGIYLTFHTVADTAIDVSVVKGANPRQEITTFAPNGDPFTTGNFNPFTLDNHYDRMETAVGGPKYGHMHVSGKKNEDWQQWFWYATDAKGQGASKSEDPARPNDWVGGWWDTLGQQVIRAIFDLSLWYWDNVMTQGDKDRTFGIRINQNAIAIEGRDPGPILDDTASYVPGTAALPFRPPDYTDSLGDSLMAGFQERMLDVCFPVSDDDDPLYPMLFRPSLIALDSALEARADALLTANKIGLVITSAEFEPRNNGHVTQSTKIRDFCKMTGGNTMGFAEGFGELPDDSSIDGNFSSRQLKYWQVLFALHIGCSAVGMRPAFVNEYNGSTEWQAILDFAAKYAGYQQFPSASPGAWVALREGNRFEGNYDFLMTQIVNGTTAHRGTELYAGSDGTSFNYPSTDYVGPPSNKSDQGSTNGTGQRQSLWAFEFSSSEVLKTQVEGTFGNSLINKSVTIRVHYLDNSPGATFAVTGFGFLLGTVVVGNSGNWVIEEFTIPVSGLFPDSDGAHVTVTPSGGAVRFHMIEVEKN